MQLKKWVINVGEKEEKYQYYLKGYVYGHTKPTCPDGTYIHTSPIESAEDMGETLTIKTGHNLYTIRKSEMDTVISVDVVRDFCKEFLDENYDIAHIANKKTVELYKNSRLLGCGMLYLQLAAGRAAYFAGAIYRERNGTMTDDFAVVEEGVFEYSVYMIHSHISWFAKSNEVEFYKTLRSAVILGQPVLGYIRNVGLTPINVKFSSGETATIMPDELYEVKAPKREDSDNISTE